MKKLISLLFISVLMSSCSLFHIHKNDVVQGNAITPEQVSRLHRGMSESEVKAIMGNPLLVNVFTPGQVSYVYTYQIAHQNMSEKRLTCQFSHGQLQSFTQS